MQDQREATAELLEKQGSLEFLPELTGGRVVTNTNGPQEKVPDIFAEAPLAVLAFEPDVQAASASGTRIEVRCHTPMCACMRSGNAGHRRNAGPVRALPPAPTRSRLPCADCCRSRAVL